MGERGLLVQDFSVPLICKCYKSLEGGYNMKYFPLLFDHNTLSSKEFQEHLHLVFTKCSLENVDIELYETSRLSPEKKVSNFHATLCQGARQQSLYTLP